MTTARSAFSFRVFYQETLLFLNIYIGKDFVMMEKAPRSLSEYRMQETPERTANIASTGDPK
jgi:hypothetical protein